MIGLPTLQWYFACADRVIMSDMLKKNHHLKKTSVLSDGWHDGVEVLRCRGERHGQENQSEGDGSDSLWRKSGTYKLGQLLWHEASVTTVQSGWLSDTSLSPPHRFDETNRLGFFLPVVLTSAVREKKILRTNRRVRGEGGWKFGGPLPLKSQMQVALTHAAAGAEHGQSEVCRCRERSKRMRWRRRSWASWSLWCGLSKCGKLLKKTVFKKYNLEEGSSEHNWTMESWTKGKVSEDNQREVKKGGRQSAVIV